MNTEELTGSKGVFEYAKGRPDGNHKRHNGVITAEETEPQKEGKVTHR
jgi:hypothetical protein